MSSIQPDPNRDHELTALEHLKIDVAPFSRLVFIRSTLNL